MYRLFSDSFHFFCGSGIHLSSVTSTVFGMLHLLHHLEMRREKVSLQKFKDEARKESNQSEDDDRQPEERSDHQVERDSKEVGIVKQKGSLGSLDGRKEDDPQEPQQKRQEHCSRQQKVMYLDSTRILKEMIERAVV